MSTIYLNGSPGYYAKRVPIHVEGATAPVLFRIREMSDQVVQEWEALQEQQIELLRSIGRGDIARSLAETGNTPQQRGAAIIDQILDSFLLGVIDPQSNLLARMRDTRLTSQAMTVRIIADALIEFPPEVRAIEDGVEVTPPVSEETVRGLPMWMRDELAKHILEASGLSQGEQDFLSRLLAA